MLSDLNVSPNVFGTLVFIGMFLLAIPTALALNLIWYGFRWHLTGRV